jgi:hypothetical protein
MSEHSPRAGWSVPKPEVIPRPTAWPAGLALGIALIAWGVIASEVIFGVGLVLFAASLAGWVRETRHDH